MGVNMSTLVGWVIVLSAFGFVGHREWSLRQRAQHARADPQRLRQGRQAAAQQKEPKKPKAKEPKPKRRAESAPQGSDAARPKAPAAVPAYGDSSDDGDAARNREFARQLNSVKQGTTFSGKTKEETRQKSVKQSRAEEVPPLAVPADAGRISAPSSTAGIDADDDSSSAATSPVLAAAAATTHAGPVDDMLEKPAPGPSVLRLTGTDEKPSYKSQKPKAAAAPEPVETKKQRQNRKKAELAKAEREAAEKDRKVKLEAQRRAARLAEGRAAKDGSAFLAAQTKQSNAWTDKADKADKTVAASAASSGANGFVPLQPLDTFDANAVHTDTSKSSVPSYDKGEDWMSSLPSEEEQMELLRGEDAWNTVKTKKSKKSKEAAPAEDAATATATKTAAAAAAPGPAPVAAAIPAVSQKPRSAQIGSQSAFAALAVDGTEEPEEEQEWDV